MSNEGKKLLHEWKTAKDDDGSETRAASGMTFSVTHQQNPNLTQREKLDELQAILDTLSLESTTKSEHFTDNGILINKLQQHLTEEKNRRQHVEEQLSLNTHRVTELEIENQRLNAKTHQYLQTIYNLEREVHRCRSQMTEFV